MAEKPRRCVDGDGAGAGSLRRRSRANMLWLLADRGVRLALAFLVGVWLAFADLPEHWCCPGCEAAKERFLLLDDGHD